MIAGKWGWGSPKAPKRLMTPTAPNWERESNVSLFRSINIPRPLQLTQALSPAIFTDKRHGGVLSACDLPYRAVACTSASASASITPRPYGSASSCKPHSLTQADDSGVSPRAFVAVF